MALMTTFSPKWAQSYRWQTSLVVWPMAPQPYVNHSPSASAGTNEGTCTGAVGRCFAPTVTAQVCVGGVTPTIPRSHTLRCTCFTAGPAWMAAFAQGYGRAAGRLALLVHCGRENEDWFHSMGVSYRAFYIHTYIYIYIYSIRSNLGRGLTNIKFLCTPSYSRRRYFCICVTNVG